MAFTDRLANRGSISTGYDVENSCRSESNETDYMHRTPGSSSNRKTFTISFWIKRGKLSALQYLFECGITDNDNGRFFGRFSTSDTFQLYGGSTNWRTTRTVFRDPSAWYHFVIAVDTTLASGNNQFRLYVNGVEETQFSTLNNVTQNTDLGCNFASKHTIGYSSVDSTGVWDGYMSEFVIIDGSQLTPSSFGETDEDSGIWKPKDVSGLTFGTNGTYLDFEASGNLGNDASGGTDWTENNIAATNQTTDSPTITTILLQEL